MQTGGFDLGLNERVSPPMIAAAPEPRTIAQTIVSEVRAAAQTQVAAEMRSMQNVAPDRSSFYANPSTNPMGNSGNFGRKEAPVETIRNTMSFSLDDEDAVPSPIAAAMPGGRTESTGWQGQRPAAGTQDNAAWEGPRPAGSHLGNLLEPMLQEEMEKLVRVAVEDYCRKHFAGIARELIQRELDRLTQDRSRLLMD
jgi:hypothetical protein